MIVEVVEGIVKKIESEDSFNMVVISNGNCETKVPFFGENLDRYLGHHASISTKINGVPGNGEIIQSIYNGEGFSSAVLPYTKERRDLLAPMLSSRQ
jgi:hypothetical protein